MVSTLNEVYWHLVQRPDSGTVEGNIQELESFISEDDSQVGF